MFEERIERLRAAYDGVNQGVGDDASGLLAPDFEVHQNGEIVVLIHTWGRGRGSGIRIDNRIAHVWTFRGDKAVRQVVYEEQAEALEAIGLGE
jgi:hypothetical protein